MKKYTKARRRAAARASWQRRKIQEALVTGAATDAATNGEDWAIYLLNFHEEVITALNAINSLYPNTINLVRAWIQSRLAAGSDLDVVCEDFTNFFAQHYFSYTKGADYESLENVYQQQVSRVNGVDTFKEVAQRFVNALADSFGYSQSYTKKKWLRQTTVKKTKKVKKIKKTKRKKK